MSELNKNNSIQIYKHSNTGKMSEKYSPLMNMVKDGSITGFSSSNLVYDFSNPLEIDCQLSYDDSINLILNNNSTSPKIINTRFAALGGNNYEYIIRNQNSATNIYDDNFLNQETDLFLRSSIWPIIDLHDVLEGGQLMCGNYIFYIKYADEDDNLSEIVSESGSVSIINGNDPESSYGALMDERTAKTILLKISNLDLAFSKFYLYFTRETSDLNGISMTKTYKILNPYQISQDVIITINGYESIEEISNEELNIEYNYYNSAKTHAIVQNMLFLGNVKTSAYKSERLQQLSYWINMSIKQKTSSIGYISSNYSPDFNNKKEYYDPKNLYYYLGYWPDEFYKFGIVYILNDGTTTPVFNLLGKKLELNEHSITEEINFNKTFEVNVLLEESTLKNTGGVFKTPIVDVINHNSKEVLPIYFEATIPDILQQELKKLGVAGYFLVRTKRIPLSLFQGLSVGVDAESGFIAPSLFKNNFNSYIIESFINADDGLLSNTYEKHIQNTNNVQYSALISLDPIVVPQLQNMLSWTNYTLHKNYKCLLEKVFNNRHYQATNYTLNNEKINSKLVFIDEDIPSFYIGNNYYSTRAGNAESVKEFSFIGASASSKTNDLVRGISCPIVGVEKLLSPSSIYTVKLEHDEKYWIKSLLDNKTIYYPVTNRYQLSEYENKINIYRGDCYTNTVTIRIHRNFIDPSVPTNDIIVDAYCWTNNFEGINSTKDGENGSGWANINLADVNSVQLGTWITYKCLSNYNLGFRALNKQDSVNLQKLGTYGSFYPINNISTRASNKTRESNLLNEGYSINLGRKEYYQWQPVPYENFHFENRIAFSNIASTKMFTNGFRIFQGLSYQDVDKQYGSIVKLFPYGQNLLCVFEHGIAIVPINEKALLSTQEGLSIHLYGAGVLQEQVSVISPDYGSTWMDSLIQTPNAFYGVDGSAKKIWKYNNTEGFVCISDFKIQSFINDNLSLDNLDKYFLGATNIKTHYNKFKGDVIFTFYKNSQYHSITYNEILGKWISRNTWMPLLSDNINNIMYSYDFKLWNTYANLYKNNMDKSSIFTNTIFYTSGKPIDLYYDNEFANNDFKLENIEQDSIVLYAMSKNIPNRIKIGDYTTSDLYYPTKVEVYVDENNNKNVIVHDSEVWTLTCPKFNEDESCWKISAVPNYKEKIDSDGKIWKFSLISNMDWSDAEIINGFDKIEGNKLTLYGNSKKDINVSVTCGDEKFKVNKTLTFIPDSKNSQFFLYKHDIDSEISTWYDKIESFEYEFIVNQPVGFHKIFNNLSIISNNVEPDSIEIDIIGDVYEFKNYLGLKNSDIKYELPKIAITSNTSYYTTLKFDKTIKEYHLLMHQDCLNIENFGRRLGNISYMEGKWNIVLQPIYYTNKDSKMLKTTRLRDKWAKIRIKYSGQDLAIITAIQTLMNISYV